MLSRRCSSLQACRLETEAESSQQKSFRLSVDIDFGTPEFTAAIKNGDDLEL